MDAMRRAGILLPVFSLPSPYGIGNLGASAREFIDFLQAAGQSLWQILPVGPTAFHDSPYQSLSAFAGNPWFIDPEMLRAEGLLCRQDLDRYEADTGSGTGLPVGPSGKRLRPWRVDYDGLRACRLPLLFRAADGFGAGDENYRRFCAKNHWWLEDFVSFMGDRRHRILQYFFFDQWERMKWYANARGVGIVGDLPLYVAESSCDFQTNPHLFQTDGAGRPLASAGVPPDDFSTEGQIWNTPLYDWAAHQRDDYGWWIRRFVQAAELYDHVRIDHFRGLEAYFSIPAAASPSEGRWEKGPGEDFIDTVNRQVPALGIIAEDLGMLTDSVHQLRRASGWPGMKVLQFAFSPEEESDYLPHHHLPATVVYTGTHDNDTLKGWARTEKAATLAKACAYLGVSSPRSLPDALIRAALSSVAEPVIIPMQDWMGMGTRARTNTPATVGRKNWSWRLPPDAMDDLLFQKIFTLTSLYERAHNRV